MKTRIISGIIGILLVIAIFFLPKIFFVGAVLVVSVIGLNEYFNVMKISSASFKAVGFVISLIFLLYYNSYNVFYYALYLLIIGSFTLVIFDYEKKNVNDIKITVLGSVFVGFMFSHILKIYNLENGNILIWLVFLGSWSTDVFAYFVGVNFGSHKLTPISPKKSLEGSIGGLIGCMIITLTLGYVFKNYYNIQFSYYHYAIIGVIAGIIGQIGDLSASLLKRSTNAKDFGNIMPGHGGVLDRFDSVLFVAPAVFYYLIFFVI